MIPKARMQNMHRHGINRAQSISTQSLVDPDLLHPPLAQWWLFKKARPTVRTPMVKGYIVPHPNVS
jgi:hypothetical protein